MNNLCSYEDTRYLEVGVYNGSTFCAAIQGNDVTAYASDHWEDRNIKPYRDDIPWKGDEGSLDTFISNVKNIWTDNSDIVVMEGDIRGTSEINFNKNVNTIFYDGEHDAATQTQCLEHILKYTDDEFVLVIDDANFKDVVESSKDFIQKNNLKILYERILLTDELEDSSSWWNGIAVFVLKNNGTI